MDELSYQDITQQYLANLVSYNGQIVYVMRVFEDRRVKVFYLQSRLFEIVMFERSLFSVIKSRLGMVNVYDSVVYLTRIPMRKMGIGINKGNIAINLLPVKYPKGKDDTVYCIRDLVYDGIHDTLTGKFPTLEKALKKVAKEAPSTIAFDRQFAVNSEGHIYYKTQLVGEIALDAKEVSEIEFYDTYKHLAILLENNHEKTIGYSCTE